jgi:predicted RNA-binding Zn ribbon-like protein
MGLYSERHLGRLLREAQAHPQAARRALSQALSLRAGLHRAFTCDHVSGADRDSIARVARLARSAQALDAGWRWVLPDTPDPRLPLLHVALSALELLGSGERERVKACPLHEGGCGWLFLDETKNRSRRWCSMAHCGSKVKTRRFAARARAQRESA